MMDTNSQLFVLLFVLFTQSYSAIDLFLIAFAG